MAALFLPSGQTCLHFLIIREDSHQPPCSMFADHVNLSFKPNLPCAIMIARKPFMCLTLEICYIAVFGKPLSSLTLNVQYC